MLPLLTLLKDVLANARAQDYAGYSKFDALNSPVLAQLAFDNKWLKLIYTQLVKASPLNIRPWLKVEKSRNPKGIALFARAYFFLYEHTADPDYLDEGQALLKWLLDNPSPGQDNLCWGYNFVWQSPLFRQDRFEPNAVVSVFVGEALIHSLRLTGNRTYLKAARSVTDFIIKDLPVLYSTREERAIAYVLRPVNAVVLNNQVLTAAFLVKAWKHTGEDELLSIARRQLNYAVNRRTDYGAWYYTYPRNKSPLRHDNYHTGGILDGLLEYCDETGDDRFMEIYWQGLNYYRRNLFEPDGAPRWMNDRKYPHDIHGAAQGIISFSKAARYTPELIEVARKTANWTIQNLYRPHRRDFAYRRGRWVKWNYSLMRWCNAWMARALAELLRDS